MRIGTTPTLTFALPFASSMLEDFRLVMCQHDNEILKKHKADFVIGANAVSVTLTEAETFLFAPHVPILVQLHAATAGGQALTSDVFCVPSVECLDRQTV